MVNSSPKKDVDIPVKPNVKTHPNYNGNQEKCDNKINATTSDNQDSLTGERNISENPIHTNPNSSSSVIQVKPDKSRFAPLRGLFINNTKKLTDQIWQEIERTNLSYIAESENSEIYLCDTNLSSIRKSLREHCLDVSQRNMENIATGRTRKLLILRIQFPQTSKLSVVGIAIVNTSASIGNRSRNGRFLLRISYLCLSIPTFPGSYLAPSLNDGVEVFSHISAGFLQQYMLALRQRNIQPLFPDVYVSASFLAFHFTLCI